MKKYNIEYWLPRSGWVATTTAELPTGSDEEAMLALLKQHKLLINVTPYKEVNDVPAKDD